MDNPHNFYKMKLELYGMIEQKLSETMHTVRSIQSHEIDAPGSDVDELKELNKMWTQLNDVRLEACGMMDALHPLIED